MTYSDTTYELIMQRMLDRVKSVYPELDIREGSLIFNALAPVAVEMAVLYSTLDNILNESYFETASREYLIKICKQFGMDTKHFDGTYAEYTADFATFQDLTSTVWTDGVYDYFPDRKISVGSGRSVWIVHPNKFAAAGNNGVIGDIRLVRGTSSVNTGRLRELSKPGADALTDAQIRNEYQAFIINRPASGNIGDYIQWLNKFPGVGKFRITPVKAPSNFTVTVHPLNEQGVPANPELVRKLQEYLDPGQQGEGDGVAPIGAKVNVVAPTPQEISVSADVKFVSQFKDTTVLDNAIKAYLADFTYAKPVDDGSTLSYLELGSALVNVNEVVSISNLKVNGGTADIKLTDDKIPTFTKGTWKVV